MWGVHFNNILVCSVLRAMQKTEEHFCRLPQLHYNHTTTTQLHYNHNYTTTTLQSQLHYNYNYTTITTTLQLQLNYNKVHTNKWTIQVHAAYVTEGYRNVILTQKVQYRFCGESIFMKFWWPIGKQGKSEGINYCIENTTDRKKRNSSRNNISNIQWALEPSD